MSNAIQNINNFVGFYILIGFSFAFGVLIAIIVFNMLIKLGTTISNVIYKIRFRKDAKEIENLVNQARKDLNDEMKPVNVRKAGLN